MTQRLKKADSKPTLSLTILLGLLVGGAGVTYGVSRWQHKDAQGNASTAPKTNVAHAPASQPGEEASTTEPKDPNVADPPTHGDPQAPLAKEALPIEPGAASTQTEATPVSGDKPADPNAPKDGKPAAPQFVAIKMDPMVANLDEGDQLRYLKVSLTLEVQADLKDKAQNLLPRARHDSLMYMSGLHLSDVQGLLGKQRVHRELQRRIADALGSGLKRVYFDEFIVQ